MSYIDQLKNEITSIFTASDYDSTLEAVEALEVLSKNKSLSEKEKLSFNRNFYMFLRDVEDTFKEKLILPTSKGIAYLAQRSSKEREQMDIAGDEYKFSFKLLDGSVRYQSAWNPETGKCLLPFQFLFFMRVVALNGYGSIKPSVQKSILVKS